MINYQRDFSISIQKTLKQRQEKSASIQYDSTTTARRRQDDDNIINYKNKRTDTFSAKRKTI